MNPNEDAAPRGYPYHWSPNSQITLDEYLKKYKPSVTQNDGTKPWIWVRGSPKTSPERDAASQVAAVYEAAELLAKVTARLEEIKNDESVPIRSNKKTGTKSKKELREKEQAEATNKLKEISQRYGYTCGKWLIFAPGQTVDKIWSDLTRSLVTGPLSKTDAWLTKVATRPPNWAPGYQHVICLYMPDVYNKEAVTKVMKILLRNHGMNLSGVKSDLYTLIGLDSKHPSGIQPTIWKNNALMKESEIKELQDTYRAEPSIASMKATEIKDVEMQDASNADDWVY